MQGGIIEAASTAVSANAADADVRVDDDRLAAEDRQQHPATDTEQTGSGTTALLAPDDLARVPASRAGTDRHVASAAIDATVDATDRATRNQRCRVEREAGAVRAL